MKVVLFCGGLGMRMREGPTSAPKPMNMIGDRPLLWHVMRYYAHFGHTDFILCLGYGAAAVKDYFVHYEETQSNDFTLLAGGRDIQMHSTDISDWNVTFIDTGLHSTIGERLMRVRGLVEGEEMFLANYADTLTDAPLDQLIERFRQVPGAAASMIAVPPVSTHHVVEVGEDDQVTRVRPVSELMQWENGGYFVLRPGIFDVLREGEDMVPHAFTRLVPGRLLAQRYTGFWRAADTFKDRAELEDMFHRGQCPWMLWDAQRGTGTSAVQIPAPRPSTADSVLAG
ncbi:MAG TPA: glucose-1-phosphate cytidylyltransferase [Rugosimonospora sp.]|nr:glucose-1-phosphate cytidylyltransferase [Rugosimonospora sp.]